MSGSEERVSANQALRLKRLAFYAGDIEAFDEALSAFVRKSGARTAMLIDQDGHMVARQGHVSGFDGATMAALVAGSFASTREVARLLGEAHFQVLFHQGPQQSIQVTLVGGRTLQVSVFDATVKPGMIQVFSRELATKVTALLDELAARPERHDQAIGDEFSTEMKDHLDNLFGGL